MNSRILKPVTIHGHRAFRDVSNPRNRHDIYNCFPGTTNFDPLWLRRDTDSASRRLQRITTVIKKSSSRTAAPRRVRHTTRSSAKSGDSNSDDGSDSEPERRQPLQLYDQAALADLLTISKKSVQNIYSKTPHLLPTAIQIPGARGPRWTPSAVEEWLSERPRHTPAAPAPVVAPKRKAGRPRIAPAVKGVQS